MPSTTRTRRLGGLTGVAVIAGLGLASFTAGGADAAEVTGLKYDCKALGGNIDAGVWTADISADLPATIKVGEKVKGPKFNVDVTTSTGIADTLRGVLQAKSVSGTAEATYNASVNMKANLTVPKTAVPASGPITTKASGTGEDLTGTRAGDVVVTAGNFSVKLDVEKQDGSVQKDVDVTCTLKTGQNAKLATIKVLPASTTTEPTTTKPTTTKPTTTEPTTTKPTTTTSTEPTTTEPSTSTSEPTGPPVQTDELGASGNATAAGLGVLALSGAAGAAVVARRRLK